VAEIVLAAINAKWIHPSRGLRLLKANLGGYEDRAEILEFALRQPLAEKIAPILAARPRILGLSVSVWNHRATAELIGALEDRWAAAGQPRPLIVLGGPEASHLPEDAAIFRRAGWVIRGEGEGVFRELCAAVLGGGGARGDALPSAEAVRGKFIFARPADLAALDPEYRLYTAEDLGRKLVYVEASRGCPFGCEFCQSSTDRGARNFPLEPFLGEMDRLIRRAGEGGAAGPGGKGPLVFKFLDRTFNLDLGRARRIMEFFLEKLESAALPRPLCVHFEMVPSRFPPELRDLIRRFPPGSLRLEVGIQTLNRETAVLTGRPGDPEGELEVLAFLRRETRAIVHADLIAALPGEGLASFGAGFDRLWLALTGEAAGDGAARGKETSPFEIQPGILKLLPGAPIARHSEAFGMRYSPEPPYEALETSALGRADLDRLKNFARFWELIVNRGAFPDRGPALFPPGEPVFDRFLALSDSLLSRFGRNWGISRDELREALRSPVPFSLKV
jgi:radical SAM superfamily enzyme YgiQ (UPF0313 family)